MFSFKLPLLCLILYRVVLSAGPEDDHQRAVLERKKDITTVPWKEQIRKTEKSKDSSRRLLTSSTIHKGEQKKMKSSKDEEYDKTIKRRGKRSLESPLKLIQTRMYEPDLSMPSDKKNETDIDKYNRLSQNSYINLLNRSEHEDGDDSKNVEWNENTTIPKETINSNKSKEVTNATTQGGIMANTTTELNKTQPTEKSKNSPSPRTSRGDPTGGKKSGDANSFTNCLDIDCSDLRRSLNTDTDYYYDYLDEMNRKVLETAYEIKIGTNEVRELKSKSGPATGRRDTDNKEMFEPNENDLPEVKELEEITTDKNSTRGSEVKNVAPDRKEESDIGEEARKTIEAIRKTMFPFSLNNTQLYLNNIEGNKLLLEKLLNATHGSEEDADDEEINQMYPSGRKGMNTFPQSAEKNDGAIQAKPKFYKPADYVRMGRVLKIGSILNEHLSHYKPQPNGDFYSVNDKPAYLHNTGFLNRTVVPADEIEESEQMNRMKWIPFKNGTTHEISVQQNKSAETEEYDNKNEKEVNHVTQKQNKITEATQDDYQNKTTTKISTDFKNETTNELKLAHDMGNITSTEKNVNEALSHKTTYNSSKENQTHVSNQKDEMSKHIEMQAAFRSTLHYERTTENSLQNNKHQNEVGRKNNTAVNEGSEQSGIVIKQNNRNITTGNITDENKEQLLEYLLKNGSEIIDLTQQLVNIISHHGNKSVLDHKENIYNDDEHSFKLTVDIKKLNNTPVVPKPNKRPMLEIEIHKPMDVLIPRKLHQFLAAAEEILNTLSAVHQLNNQTEADFENKTMIQQTETNKVNTQSEKKLKEDQLTVLKAIDNLISLGPSDTLLRLLNTTTIRPMKSKIRAGDEDFETIDTGVENVISKESLLNKTNNTETVSDSITNEKDIIIKMLKNITNTNSERMSMNQRIIETVDILIKENKQIQKQIIHLEDTINRMTRCLNLTCINQPI